MLAGMGTPRGNAGGLVLLAVLLGAALVWVATFEGGADGAQVTRADDAPIERVWPEAGERTRETPVREAAWRTSEATSMAQRERVAPARPAQALAQAANWKALYPQATPIQLSGEVLDAARRRPVEGALVEVALPGQAGLMRRAQTNAEGHFQLDWYHGVPSQLVIEHPEFVRFAALDIENEDLYALTASGAIQGVVRRARHGSDASKASEQVTLWQQSSQRPEEWLVKTTALDEDGRFRFADLDPGMYALCPGGDDVAGRYVTGLEVLPGETLEVEAELVPGLQLTGRVLMASSTGSPTPDARFAGARVALIPLQVGMPTELSFGEIERQTADADGRFDFQGLRTGTYRLVVALPWGGLFERTIECSEVGARVEADLIVAPPSSIRGVVVDATGRPVSGADVYATHSASATQSASDGQFCLEEVPSGRLLLLSAKTAGPESEMGSMAIAPIETGTHRDNVRLVVMPTLTILGRLEAEQATGENGTWLANGYIDVEQKQGSVKLLKQQVVSDEYGEFELKGLGRALTTLTLHAPGSLPKAIAVDLGDPAATLAGLTLRELEQGAERCVFTLEPALVIHGVVRDEFGAALPEVFVLAKAKDTAAGLPDRMTETNGVGQFRFPSLAEADWEIVPRDPAWLVVKQVPPYVNAAFVQSGADVELVLRRRAERTKAALRFDVVRAVDGLAPSNLSVIGARDAAVSIQGGDVSITGLDPAIRNLLLVADECAAKRIQPGLVAGVESRMGVIELQTGVTLSVRVVAPEAELLRIEAVPLPADQGGPVAGTPEVQLTFDGQAYRLAGLPMGKWRLRVLGQNGEIASEVLTLDQPVFEHTVEL